MNSLDTLPLDKIDVGDGFNPRSEITLDEGFLASVKTHGILTPILVHPQGSGKATRYFLVAGERRYRAAQAAGLTEIPAVIRAGTAGGDALPTALVENMQREQLTPLEEARAFKRAHDDGLTGQELADQVGVSLDTIRQRIRLLDLPEKVQEHVDAGAVTLKTAGELQQLAPFGDTIVAKTADLLVASQDGSSDYEPIVPGDLARDPQWMLERVLSELGDEAPFVVHVRKGVRINLTGYGSVEWPDGVDAEPLVAKLKQLPEHGPDYKPIRGAALEIKQEDIDAARAYGCLLELGDQVYLNDPVWLLDLLDAKVDKAVKSWERKQKAAAKKNGAGDATTSTDPAEAEREQKRKERAEQHAAQLSARERNISLRHALMEMHAPELTLDAIRAVGELLLEYAGTDLGHAWRFVDERCETVKTKKSGEISSLTYSRNADGLLLEAFRAADTPKRALGVLLKALVAARFVDTTAARQSDRYMHIRGMSEYGPGNRAFIGAVEAIAEPILPPDIKLELKERRDNEAVERCSEAREVREQLDEGAFRGVLCPACGDRGGSGDPCTCTVDEILAALEACPRCGEEDCHATCTGFHGPAEIAAEEAAVA